MTDIYNYEKKQEKQTLIEADTGKRSKEQFVENLREGDAVNDYFAVKIKNPPRQYKKGFWFDFMARDKTGEIMVKYWGGENKDRIKRLYDSFSIGDVVQVRTGYVETYEERPQISINESTGGIRRCNPKEYDVADFITAIDAKKIQELYTYIQKQIKTIKNQQLSNLLDLFFKDPAFVEKYTHSPSAMTHHHNYVGGNLEHTVGTVRLCVNICEMYPNIDKEILLTGAILHDVGKLKEYTGETTVDRTELGNFIGHIVIGDRWIQEKITELRKNGKPFDQTLENKLHHLILSHHGKHEWGSPVIPKTVEAQILHFADLMDSQVKNYIQNIENAHKATDDTWSSVYDSNLKKKRMIYLGESESKK